MHAQTIINKITIQPTPTPIAVLVIPFRSLVEALFIEDTPTPEAVGLKVFITS